MYELEIYDEEGLNSLSMDDEFAHFSIDVSPESKKYESRMNLKDDVYYRTEKCEYRIKTDPIKVEVRLQERLDEPPRDYKVRDGVVLEADILKKDIEVWNGRVMPMTTQLIENLKKEVEWHDEGTSNPISMYILSKHPEIIAPDDYKRYLRQMAERIKTATLKIEQFLGTEGIGLQITDEYSSSGRSIWYPKSKQDTMSEEETKTAIDHQKQVLKRLFDENSADYVGISENDFRTSPDTLKSIDLFLGKKITPVEETRTPQINTTKSGSAWKWLIVIVLTVIALSGGIWTAIGVFVLGAIIVGILLK